MLPLSTLQNVPLPESLKATGDIKEAVERAEMILTVIPTPFLFKSMSGIKEYLREDQYIVSCTKGILNDTLETPDGIIRRALPDNLCKRSAFCEFDHKRGRGLWTGKG